MLNRLRLPNFSYNSATGILTTQFTSSPVHKTLGSTIYTGLTDAVKSLPRDIQLSITIVTNEGFMGFKGVYLSVRNGAVRPSWGRTRTDDISSSRPVFSKTCATS